MSEKHRVAAIILAAGSGARMGESITKQRLILCGKSVLYHSVFAFSECDFIDSITVVCREDEIAWATQETASFSKVKCVVPGGKTRAESAKIGFDATSSDLDFIAIHDAARCLITPEEICFVVSSAIKHGAATAGTYVTDTVKMIKDGDVEKTLPRESLFTAQTPQIFARDLYASALESAEIGAETTDDNMLVERLGIKVRAVDTGRKNIKITTPDDLNYAEYVIAGRGKMPQIRIGNGYDVHRLVEGRRLILGGVDIPHVKGLLGHSDADVLTHAIMDALLGAAALGDIGKHFPDTDDRYRGISSLSLLRQVAELLNESGFEIENIDATIVAQKPKIAPYISEMAGNIAKMLGIEQGRVNVKATTEEGLGFTGREEGICAHAVCIIKK